MIKTIFVIVSHPLSDLGKGWVGGSIASLVPNSFMLKIDPMMNRIVANNPWENEQIMESNADLQTYQKLGLGIGMDSLLISGNVLSDFLFATATHIGTLAQYGHPSRALKKNRAQTLDDASQFLSRLIERRAGERNAENLVVEIGGTVGDPESHYIVRALRLLAMENNAELKWVLLTHFDFQEANVSKEGIKTRIITHAIEALRMHCGEPWKVLVRQRLLPFALEKADLHYWKRKISLRGNIPTEKILYVPNVPGVFALRNFLATELFGLLEWNEKPAAAEAMAKEENG